MKLSIFCAAVLASSAAMAADSTPDTSFYENAAQGGMAEVELSKLAVEKGTAASVKEYAAMMVKDHTAANKKLMALAAKKQVKLPTSPSMMQKASKTKLNMMSGDSFDKSYIKTMVSDHKDTIELFQKEATSGEDADAKAFAAATLPTLQTHLKKIQAVASSNGVSAD